MFSKVFSFSLYGMQGILIEVEVDINMGLPSLDIVGLPDTAVKESKERVKSSLKNSRFNFPISKITVNLAPAGVRKEGSSLDLAIALGILISTEQLEVNQTEKFVLLGELSLDGLLKPIKGILPILISAKEKGFRNFIIPKANAKEASYIEDVNVYALNSLKESADLLKGLDFEKVKPTSFSAISNAREFSSDFRYVKGQVAGKRAVEIAVSGGHNILLKGPPGTGKTMIAKCIPSIMPDLSFEEALEVTKIHSVAGVLDPNEGIITKRPFRSPHHTASTMALTGGGKLAKPGEISLSHNGVLFLDEMPEFSKQLLETLRQPLEDKIITISRVEMTVEYLANIMLVGSMNPCPCGNFGSEKLVCTCSTRDVLKYKNRISSPLLDRIDLVVQVDSLNYDDLTSNSESESSKEIKKRVEKAREIQRERFKNDKIQINSQMSEREMKKYCCLTEDCENLLKLAFERLNMSARGRNRVIKVARTIADLYQIENIDKKSIMEAINYRNA